MQNPTLATLETALRAIKTAASERLDCRDHLARLDEIARLAGSSLPSDLRHYLRNRSYDKALLLLQGHDPETSPARCG
ncbi:MAG TPA: hypothetical protein PLU30_27650 [Verrucomicrobiae bacterium]|nr:hypothetical protein [Verrucomicrobiae bacterium]